jgi:RHS repeat-associated protein
MYQKSTCINAYFRPSKRPENTVIFRPKSTGKEKDAETGYHYFGARYYNSDLSLWLSVDPMSDKYPSLSPYNYCAWNPMKLVDPDGAELETNTDWYKDRDGHVHWNANVHSQSDLKDGETYLGRTTTMIAEGEDMMMYGDQYGHKHSSIPLREITVTETLTDFERTMQNPIVQSIHQSASSFWEYPVTEAVVDVTLTVVTGGIMSGIGKSALKSYSKYKARTFFKNAKYTEKVLKDMAKDKNLHGFPSSVDTYASAFGKYSVKKGGDHKKYHWLTMRGGYNGYTGTFEYIKDGRGLINHRFLNTK